MNEQNVCNVCGKRFDEWDAQENFGFDYYVGYGSKYDLTHLSAHICIDCFDKLMDDFIPKCRISPVLGEYELLSDDERHDIQRIHSLRSEDNMTEQKFHEICRQAVCDYANQHLDPTDHKEITTDDVYIVWACKTLQNNKALLSTTLFDGMYYELTYNGDKHELYFDAYKKFENRCIHIDE